MIATCLYAPHLFLGPRKVVYQVGRQVVVVMPKLLVNKALVQFLL